METERDTLAIIRSASSSGTTVTFNLWWDTIPASGATSWDSDLTTARVSISEKPQIMDWYIPGQQVADGTNPTGKQYLTPKNSAIYAIAIEAWVWTAASWAWAALTFNVYDDGGAIMSSAPDFTTNTTVQNSTINNPTIAAGSRMTLRTPASAWATNQASDLNVIVYYADQAIYDNV